MFGRVMLLGSALTAALATLPVPPASAANFLELNFNLSGPRYDGVAPTCDNSYVLNRIATRFGEKERGFWQSNLSINGFVAVRETSFRSWAPNTIPRRFCSGYALVSDGVKRPVHYVIGEDTGIIGTTWGVEYCVVGLDRNEAYSPACRMAQP